MFTLQDLREELNSSIYQGKSYNEIVDILLTVKIPVLGTIAGDDLRDVVTMLCEGIAFRLKTAPLTEGRVMLETAFDKMSIDNFQFNFAAPKVVQMLQHGVTLGLISEDERDKFYQLATKLVPVWDGVTVRDVVQCMEPHLLELNTWTNVDVLEPACRWVEFQLATEIPEKDVLVIEISLSRDGILWTEYSPYLVIPNIQKPNIYIAPLPPGGNFQRKLRWKGATYKLTGLVAVTL